MSLTHAGKHCDVFYSMTLVEMSLTHAGKRLGRILSNDSHRNIDVSPGFFTRFGFDSVSVSIRLIRKISNGSKLIFRMRMYLCETSRNI